MEKFTTYKGFKIEKSGENFLLWGKSLYNPVDVTFGCEKSETKVKKVADIMLEVFKLDVWPILFPDRICKH